MLELKLRLEDRFSCLIFVCFFVLFFVLLFWGGGGSVVLEILSWTDILLISEGILSDGCFTLSVTLRVKGCCSVENERGVIVWRDILYYACVLNQVSEST